MVAKEPEDERQRDWIYLDFGQATANMMITATDLGIGSGHSAVADQAQAQRVLGFPDGYLCVFMVASAIQPTGRAAAQQPQAPPVRRRRPLGPLVAATPATA